MHHHKADAVGEIEHLESSTAEAPSSDKQFAEFDGQSAEWHAIRNKSLVRRLDRRILPWILLMYLTNYLDRTALSQARLGSLEQDLGLVGTQFNTITSILFVGYILLQIPSNLLLTKVRPSLYLCGCMFCWGAISAAQGATHNFIGALLSRLFLGAVEAPFFSGAVFLLSSWYRNEELATRIAAIYIGPSLATMFGGLIAAGVLDGLDGARGIAAWRWLFIIEGTATCAIALISVFALPDYPHNTRWLSDEEKRYAEWRLSQDAAGEPDDPHGMSPWVALKGAFTDYKLYLFMLLHHCNLLAQSFTYFFPSIVETLNYGRTVTLLLTVPVWFVALVSTLLVSYHSSRVNERCYHIVIGMMASAAGNIIAAATPATPAMNGVRMFAMYLMPIGVLPAFQLNLTWLSTTFPRPPAKRAVVIAATGMIGNAAATYGAYMYPSTDGPHYLPACVGLAGVLGLGSAVALFICYCLVRENKKLEALEQEGGEAPFGMGFRYPL